MGMKRKASDFEEDIRFFDIPQNSRRETPSLASSSPLSSSTIQSSSSGEDQRTNDFYRVKAIPYWNSRTRKRHRDGRPDEEAIHENTLKKLYDAQRLHLDEAMAVSEAVDFNQYSGQVEGDEDSEMADTPPEAELPQIVQWNQRTLDAFFGGVGSGQSTSSESRSAGIWEDRR